MKTKHDLCPYSSSLKTKKKRNQPTGKLFHNSGADVNAVVPIQK